MGLLKHLLFWPVTGPQFLIEFSLGKVNDTVREQLTDDQIVKEELMALQMQLELGDIDDAEYVRREMELMQRLRDVRSWREEYGMGTSGGPVQVRRDPGEEPAVAEHVVAAPEGTDDRVDEAPKTGGIASSEGAVVEFNFDWEEEDQESP
ncbi:hypothetical protein BH23GEM6_BH23GEM6_23120 [soil metagenome]